MRGFTRVSAAVPVCRVADIDGNRRRVLDAWKRAHEEGCALVVFPELALTAYTLRDLFHDGKLIEAAREALATLAEEGGALTPLAAVGLPLRVGSSLYNVAAVLHGGRVLGIVPKSYLPNYREFEEQRWFRSGREVPAGSELESGGERVPFGTDLLFEARGVPDLVVGFELCEDLWVQIPPSSYLVSAGATVIGNLSASNFTVGKAELRRTLARSASDRGKCAYVYTAAGPGESSTDLAFDADAFICENGALLSESTRFERDEQLVVSDVDLELLIHERMATRSFDECAQAHARPMRRIAFEARAHAGDELRRVVPKHPFLPADDASLARRCWEVFEIQTHALATRLVATGAERLVLGVSGGLDSTHAALVAANALDQLGRPRGALLCVNMPGPGTSAGTAESARRLAAGLGAEFEEVGIDRATHLLLQSVRHAAADSAGSIEEVVARVRAAPETGDAAFENVQARLRTLVLMTLANQHDGIVVGTGDLSEKALGWSTYAGDQIAMYDVNAGVPKTLVRFLIRWVARDEVARWSAGEPAELAETLAVILDTPISPELLPAEESGAIGQLTEDTLGPFELHDFFLYHLVRHGARPARILDLARVAFAGGAVPGDYELDELKRWLGVFYRRFFSNQFKRSCTADAPKVGMVALSPRADWRMPSDAVVAAWVEEVERYPVDPDLPHQAMKRDARQILEEHLELDILPQPDDSTCGPTCLQAVYGYYGDEVDLHQLISETQRLDGGGTLAVMLAVHALERGYSARIHTFNLQVFDPTWFAPGEPGLVEGLRAQERRTRDLRIRLASQWYLRFLELGGEIVLKDLTARLVREYLRRGQPLLTGLSATFLYRCVRERLQADETLTDDDVTGAPQGHFVVLCGYHKGDRTVLVADPLLDNPVSDSHRYEVNIDRLLNAILLGILTQDANLLVIRPESSEDPQSANHPA